MTRPVLVGTLKDVLRHRVNFFDGTAVKLGYQIVTLPPGKHAPGKAKPRDSANSLKFSRNSLVSGVGRRMRIWGIPFTTFRKAQPSRRRFFAAYTRVKWHTEKAGLRWQIQTRKDRIKPGAEEEACLGSFLQCSLFPVQPSD